MNNIDNGHSALRDWARRVKLGQTLRSTAVAFDAISEGLRRIMSYQHFWMRNAALDEPSKVQSLVVQAK